MATRTLASPPQILPLYVRAAAPLIPGASLLPGVPGRAKEIPELALELPGVRAKAEDVAAYAAAGQKWLCGADGTGMLYVAPPSVSGWCLSPVILSRTLPSVISPIEYVPEPSGPLCLIASSIFLTRASESFPAAPAMPHMMVLTTEMVKKGSIHHCMSTVIPSQAAIPAKGNRSSHASHVTCLCIATVAPS